jgi:hypothetical protein
MQLSLFPENIIKQDINPLDINYWHKKHQTYFRCCEKSIRARSVSEAK